MQIVRQRGLEDFKTRQHAQILFPLAKYRLTVLVSQFITINILMWPAHPDPSPDVWLAGDLTNHNSKSAILSDKQIRFSWKETLDPETRFELQMNIN